MSEQKNQLNRRQLLTSIVTATGVVALWPVISRAEGKRGGGAAAAGGAVLVDPKDPVAQGVKYAHAHKDVKDKAVQTERQGVKWADQSCSNCALYDATKATTVSGMKCGGCALFPGKVVAEKGWCTSWAKKA